MRTATPNCVTPSKADRNATPRRGSFSVSRARVFVLVLGFALQSTSGMAFADEEVFSAELTRKIEKSFPIAMDRLSDRVFADTGRVLSSYEEIVLTVRMNQRERDIDIQLARRMRPQHHGAELIAAVGVPEAGSNKGSVGAKISAAVPASPAP